LGNLLRINEIDRRLFAPASGLLRNPEYASSITFPKGEFFAGALWPSDAKPTTWRRSDGSTDSVFPGKLSDRLGVLYASAKKLYLTDCENQAKPVDLIMLEPQKDKAEVILQNVAKYLPTPDYEVVAEGGYDVLTYLVWYYRLGEWDTYSGE